MTPIDQFRKISLKLPQAQRDCFRKYQRVEKGTTLTMELVLGPKTGSYASQGRQHGHRLNNNQRHRNRVERGVTQRGSI